MFDEIELGREFFEGLMAIDAAILARAGGEACRFCGGPLHRGDYVRKPRGGLVAAAAEEFVRRFSLCCGREGSPTVDMGQTVSASHGVSTAAPSGSAPKPPTGQ